MKMRRDIDRLLKKNKKMKEELAQDKEKLKMYECKEGFDTF